MSETQPTPAVPDLINELQWRGLLHQCTDEDGLRRHLADPAHAPRKIYSGFDPTADSLTIGNLVPIMLLAHVKRAGHTPVVVMGGGTGLIGDPSGKSAERQLNTADMVAANVEAQRPIYNAVLGKIDGPAHAIANNLDWLSKISYIDALRDIGKHFSVNMMMQKDSVKSRLESREQGISYTEFSYMILQAYDFAHLNREAEVTVQIGGSDQFGNIVAGIDFIWKQYLSLVEDAWESVNDGARQLQLVIGEDEPFLNVVLSVIGDCRDAVKHRQIQQIDYAALMKTYDDVRQSLPDWFMNEYHRFAGLVDFATEVESFGITAPLVTKADGTKFGKTESGAVWLSAPSETDTPEQRTRRTSPYAYYQFWLNATDGDAVKWIKIFTFLDEATITELIARHTENPGMRELQRTLAQHATTILHGEDAMLRAEAAGKALFSGEIAGLDKQTLLEVLADVPSSEHARAGLDGEGADPIAVLKETGLASSNREAREFLSNGSVSLNGAKIDADTRINTEHLLHGSLIAIRRGKKKWHLTRWA